MLVKNKIKFKTKAKVDEETLYSIIKQKPNNKMFFFFRFNAWVHYKFDNEKRYEARDRKKIRIEKRNEKRLEKGKDPIKKSSETWRDRIVENIGEELTVYDSLKTELSQEQLEIYLKKNGYFSSSVEHRLRQTRKKVKLKYVIDAGQAHFIDSITWQVSDSLVKNELPKFKPLIESSVGDQFRVENLDNDREIITNYLSNNGFYGFSKEYISFRVDTLNRDHKASLIILISNPLEENKIAPDSLSEVSHYQYVIGRVNFHLDYDAIDSDFEATEKILIGNHTFNYIDELELDPELLIRSIRLKQGELYKFKNEADTYRKLRSLGVFNYINIKYKEGVNSKGKKKLDVDIYLNSGKSKSLSLEVTGTHRDGTWGANMRSGFRNTNLWKGAENLDVAINFGAEAQRSIIDTDDENSSSISENLLRLNTLQLGGEINFNIHKFFLLNNTFHKWHKRKNSPLTTFSLVVNYQIRPDFERFLTEINPIKWKYNENPKNLFKLSLMDLSLIDIRKSEAFQNVLNQIDNQFLLNSYRDHIILNSFKGSWDHNGKNSTYQKRFFYNRLGFEEAGGIFDAFNLGKPDDEGFLTVDRIRYAQYVKVQNDFKYYMNLSKNHSIASRIDFGVGVPFGNALVLPFEKSFFAGGANDNRAWQPRSLGPGSFRDSTALVTFNNLGEVKLTLSSEYRFDLTNLLEGAIFLDAGNIWILDDEDNAAGTEFSSKFIKEIAMGAGVGFRLDFDFFLIRLDLGFKLKDPSLISGEKWAWQPKTEYESYLSDLRSLGVTEQERYRYLPNINLGIGYPF